MRYAVAAAISLILIVVSVVFVRYVITYMLIAKDFGTAMPSWMVAMISIAGLMRRCWYVFLILFLAVPLAIAAMFPTQKAEKI
jgi:hypothetical protein